MGATQCYSNLQKDWFEGKPRELQTLSSTSVPGKINGEGYAEYYRKAFKE